MMIIYFIYNYYTIPFLLFFSYFPLTQDIFIRLIIDFFSFYILLVIIYTKLRILSLKFLSLPFYTQIFY